MYRPKDVYRRLGISATSLRRYSSDFGDFLGPTAGEAISESGGPAQRRYTEADIVVLAAIKQAYDAGLSRDEVMVRLRRGTLDPAPDHVVAGNASAKPTQTNHEPLIEVAVDTSLPATSPVGGFANPEMQAAMLALIQSAPTISDALAQVEATSRALQETTAAQQDLLHELRAERDALEAARAELQAMRDSPLVPNTDHEPPPPPPTWAQRLKRVLSGEA